MFFCYTCVYWDVDDWCPCDDTDPGIIYGRIKSALFHEGFPSDLIIRAYVEPNRFPDELLRKYKNAGFLVEEKNSARVNRMLVDIVLWALNTRRPANFIVITKISQHTELVTSVLLSLKERGCNVFLALPDTSVPEDLTISVSHRGRNIDFLQLPDHTEIRVWICPNLFEKKPYFEAYAEDYEEDYEYTEDIGEVYVEDYEEDYEYDIEEDYEEDIEEDYEEDKEEAYEVDKEESFSHEEDKEESFSQGIPKAITFSMDSESGDGKTGIFWDVMDYPLPADLDSSSFYENIKSFLEEKGYPGDLFIWAYVPDDDDSLLPPNYLDLGNRFNLVPKVPGDKHARLNKVTVDLLLWAMDNPVQRPCRPNLLVISKNMELKTRFYPILRGLKSRGYIVFLALPDADADKEENNIVTSILPWKSLLSRA